MIPLTCRAAELQSRILIGAPGTVVGHAYHKTQVDTVAGLASDHLHKRQAEGEGVKPRPRMVRVGKELASLSVSLPDHGTYSSPLHALASVIVPRMIVCVPYTLSAYCSGFQPRFG
jgi:hypothetical protein